MFPDTLESERLAFERLCRENVDLFELYELLGAGPDVEEVFEYLDESPHATVKETFEKVRAAEERFENGESVQYAIRPTPPEPDAGALAGVAGLYPKWDRRFATLGIVLDKRFWGRGYSGERAEVLIELAFDRLDLEAVAVMFIDGNERSKRAVEKYVERFNGRYEGKLRNWLAVEGEVYDCHRYSISRTEYNAATKE